VVANLQTLRQLPHGDISVPGKAFDGQQRLMLLGCHSGAMRGFFAEMQKLPQRIAQVRQRFIFRFADFQGVQYRIGIPADKPARIQLIYIVIRYKYKTDVFPGNRVSARTIF